MVASGDLISPDLAPSQSTAKAPSDYRGRFLFFGGLNAKLGGASLGIYASKNTLSQDWRGIVAVRVPLKPTLALARSGTAPSMAANARLVLCFAL